MRDPRYGEVIRINLAEADSTAPVLSEAEARELAELGAIVTKRTPRRRKMPNGRSCSSSGREIVSERSHLQSGNGA